MGKIIQRDFFPDLAKLKAQNEYLDAIATNDVIKLRQIFNKYSKRRPALSKCSKLVFKKAINFIVSFKMKLQHLILQFRVLHQHQVYVATLASKLHLLLDP